MKVVTQQATRKLFHAIQHAIKIKNTAGKVKEKLPLQRDKEHSSSYLEQFNNYLREVLTAL